MTSLPIRNQIKSWGKKVRSAPLHPFLLAWYFILFYYANNQQGLTTTVVILPLIVACVATGWLLLLAFGLYRNVHRAAVLALFFVAAFFSYGHLMGALPNLTILVGERVIGKPFIVFAVIAVIMVLAGWKLYKAKQVTPRSTVILNAITLFLMGLSIVSVAPIEWQRISNARQAVRSDVLQVLSASTKKAPAVRPDIYYLIYDRYGGNQTLKDYYNFDNSAITDYLKTKGFYVAEESVANYPRTIFSLSSSLNMDYIQNLVEMDNPAKSEATTLKWLYSHSAVAQMLKSYGYTYYHLGNWYENTHKMAVADKNVLPTQRDFPHEDFFNSKLLGTTIYPEIAQKFFAPLVPKEWNIQHQQWVMFQKSALKSLVGNNGPKFVVSHMLMPHEPYVFEADCTPRQPGVGAPWASPDDYAAQVQCTNLIIRETIDAILANSSRPPIIIVQGDEGPEAHVHEMTNHTTFHNASMGAVLERGRIMNAYYFPDHNYQDLHAAMTPVNSFRLIFRQYFGLDLPKLIDKTYVFYSSDDMFQLLDVTEPIKQANRGELSEETMVKDIVKD